MTKVDLLINISKDDRLIINPERIKLLLLVQSTGSLLRASEQMGISYNKAWNMLEAMNKASGQALIQKVRGGKGGGGAQLTDYGTLILNEYKAIEGMVEKFKEKLNTEINL